ncbi:hypothetical protein TNCV_1099781 [Trichonephila clavipes]|nr:hypothetical protein TNCV_1099781 [Trichonephila clavipes]
MNGSEKITPLIIRKSAKPRCFKDNYVQVDTTITIWRALSVALDHNNSESDEDESEKLTPITLTQAKEPLNKLRNFQNHVDVDVFQASFILQKSRLD